jgi:hypothetical protein
MFPLVLQFPLPSAPPVAPHSSSSIIIQAWYSRPVVASVIVDSFPLHPKKQKEGGTVEGSNPGSCSPLHRFLRNIKIGK